MIVQVIFEGLRKCEDVAASLDERDLEFLEAACLLHSVGLFIGKKGYQKQTYHIIMVCISFSFFSYAFHDSLGYMQL